MKEKIIQIFSPLLLCLLRLTFRDLKPLFVTENEWLKECLEKNNFHLALCNHPSILFGYRENNHYCTSFLDWKIKFISQCVRIKILSTQKGHKLLNKLGIDLHFGNGVEFWFEESHSPIVPYSIPTSNVVNQKPIAVYTALTGNYDNVNEILYKEDNVDYFLFTNNPSITSDTWQVVYIDSNMENQLLSRHIKMFPHKYLSDKYDESIYVDANIVIYGELSTLTSYIQGEICFSVSKHGERTTVLQEVERISQVFKYVDKTQAMLQYNSYLKMGFQDNLGLAECSILVRRHSTKNLQSLMDAWWNEFQNGVRRDQISLMPCIWGGKFENYILMDGYVRHNQFCIIVSHNK